MPAEDISAIESGVMRRAAFFAGEGSRVPSGVDRGVDAGRLPVPSSTGASSEEQRAAAPLEADGADGDGGTRGGQQSSVQWWTKANAAIFVVGRISCCRSSPLCVHVQPAARRPRTEL